MRSIFKIYGTNVGNILACEDVLRVIGGNNGNGICRVSGKCADERLCAVLRGKEAF